MLSSHPSPEMRGMAGFCNVLTGVLWGFQVVVCVRVPPERSMCHCQGDQLPGDAVAHHLTPTSPCIDKYCTAAITYLLGRPRGCTSPFQSVQTAA